jgi:transcription elongation GreA/GreB family factor
MNVSKEALKSELIQLLQATLTMLQNAHAAAIEGATHEEAKPEDDKDTRGLEQSYLARGQAQRIETLQRGLAAVLVMNLEPLKSVSVGAVVELEDEHGHASAFWLAPEGAGLKLNSKSVQVLTIHSPLGQALIGKSTGDEAEFSMAGKVRTMTLIRVR